MDDIADLVTIGHRATSGRHWIAGTAAAAAVIVLVVALVVLRPREPEAPANQPIEPVPAALLEPGTRWVLATGLDPDASDADSAVSASVTVSVDADLASSIAGGRVVGAEARISTGDVPPLQYLGSVQFVVESSGSVRVPLIMLDPERPWVDCDATVDVTTDGRATCAPDSVEYRSRGTTAESVDTPVGPFEATGASVEWSLDGSPNPYRTTIWSAAGIGPVRIEIDDNESVRTYVLTTLDPPITEPTGD
jgi:hypothetical protein